MWWHKHTHTHKTTAGNSFCTCGLMPLSQQCMEKPFVFTMNTVAEV